MLRAIWRWLILTVSVWVAAHIVPGVSYDNWQSLVLVALVLGILNSVVKPILTLVSLPFILLTFGIFILLINAALFKLAAYLITGFHVASFWSALGASLVISIVGMFFKSSPPNKPKRRQTPPPSHPSGGSNIPPGKGPIIDI